MSFWSFTMGLIEPCYETYQSDNFQIQINKGSKESQKNLGWVQWLNGWKLKVQKRVKTPLNV